MSLSNVDVKVGLAERMKEVIHHVIQWDQIVYIRGEPMGLINDLLIYCAEHKNFDGNTFTANMRKALDSVEHSLTLISPEGLIRNPPTAMLLPLLRYKMSEIILMDQVQKYMDGPRLLHLSDLVPLIRVELG